MNSERWQKIKGLFDAALELAPNGRKRFLDKSCGNDDGLRREVEKLLASFETAESFMESPAAAEVASLIVETNQKNQKLKSGQKIAHYETLRQIGEGGMGEVYLAQDTRLNRKVALKILPANLTADKSRLQRFKQEAQAASALNHPNIITIYEIREYKKTHLIATEYVEGETIRQKMAGVNMKTPEILDIAAQVASALSVAHQAGVIHRDIKPENIMIRPDGIVKLLDFGLAKLIGFGIWDLGLRNEKDETLMQASSNNPKSHIPNPTLTSPGMVMGTVNYMSPEQAQGKSVDRRTDLWSLGVCLYEMLAGKTPFTGETINHTLVAIMENQPPPLVQVAKSVPAELGQIAAKLLEKKPENRYLTANDLLSDLRRLKKLIESEPHKTDSGHFTTAKTELIPENTLIWEETFDAPVPNNLSGQLLPLVGREKEIAEIEDLLKRGDARLLTLTGIGGTGKTRLAFEIAQKMLSEFADGVFFIPLAAVRNYEFVASEIARPLGVKDAGGKSLLETLKDFLKEKRVFLIVDNFEQVLPAAPVLNELLAAAPGLKMLVTSRALLRLRFEREFVVPPLAVPSDIAGLLSDDLLQYEAVKLFTERAQAVKSNFAATKENLQVIAEICSRLDGLPLAIELAAARVKILSPQAILTRLESSFNLLTGGARDLPAHQQTMRGAIEWSFDLLEDDEKILFRRLSVFAGGFTIEAAESVVEGEKRRQGEEEKRRQGEEEIVSDTQSISSSPHLLISSSQIDVLDIITSLVDKSLLVQKEQADGESRFRLLEVVREYGLESLAAGGELKEMRRSHAEFFLDLATTAQPNLSGTEQPKWFSILESEHDNLRAALVWSLEKDVEKALRLARALWQFWFVRGHLSEGSANLGEVLCRTTDLLIPVRGEALVGAGFLERMRGNLEKAYEFCAEARTLGEKIGDADIIASALNGLGIVAAANNDETAARAFLEEGLRVSRASKNQRFIGLFLNNLGERARQRGDYAEARRLYLDSLAIQRELGNTRVVAIALGNLGRVSFLQNDFDAAREFFAESLEINRSLGDLHSIALLLDGFAGLAANAQPERAAELLGAANGLRQTVGSDFDKADKEFYERIYQTVEANLEKENLGKYLSIGGALKLEQAISLALDVHNLYQSNAANGRAITPFQTPGEMRRDAKSIAVLPFLTVGLKEDEEYLGLGLADALITQLSQTRQLTVRPTNAVRHYLNQKQDAMEIGRELRVGAVLAGNLQRSGENLRVTVQLINAETDAMIWAEKFNLKFTDFFEVQDAIAEQVSRALLLKLNSEERERLTKRYTENNAAYLEYLRGRYFWNKRDVESFQKAIRHFKTAIDLDPTFALAYAGLADTYSSLPIWGAGAAHDFYPRARAAALRALEIDDRLAEAHASLGYVKYLYDWDFAGVEKSYRRAIELNPNYATVRAWFGKFLVTMRRFDEALTEMKQADKLDPLSPQVGAALGGLYLYSRQYDKAIGQYDRVLDENPNLVPALFGLGMAYAEKGMFAEAVAAHEKAVELSAKNPVLVGTLAGTRAMAGEREAALKTIEELKPEYEKCEMLSYSIATVYARLNEKQAAFKWLEKAYAERNSQLPDLDIDPEFDNLRDDSRFENLRRRIGLAAQPTDETTRVENRTVSIKPITGNTEIAHSTSSAEYIFGEVKRHKRGALITLAVLALILTGATAFYFYNANQKPKFSSIAVLPLHNASGDANLDYLSDGLSENLINKLAQIGQLKVIAQSSAFRFKGKDFDPKEAGQTLGVEALLAGRITKFGDGLSIGVELIDARDGSIVWNEKYNLNSFDAAFDTELVQGRIALQLAAKLNLDLTGTQDEQLRKRSTQNPQAYQLYLNAALVKRKSNSVETHRKAIDYYNQAIALDPNFAPAYASLANSYRFLHASSSVGNKKELEEKLRRAITRAQELDDTLPEIYTTLGGIKLNEFDLTGAEKAYKRAVELNPNSAGAHIGYANYLTNAGKFDEALTHNRLAQQLDPLSMGLKITEGRTLFVARRYDEAIRLLQTLAKTAPDNPATHYYLAISYTFKGMFAEALAAHEKAKEISGEEAGEFYIYTLAKAGKTEQARQYLEKAKKRENYSPAEFAVAYIALGDNEQAFASLEKAFQERDPQLQYLKIDPHYDEIRSDPRFQDLMRRIGLSE